MDYKKKYLKYKLKYLTAKKAFKGGDLESDYFRKRYGTPAKATFSHLKEGKELDELFFLVRDHLLERDNNRRRIKRMKGNEETEQEAAKLLLKAPETDVVLLSKLKESKINFELVDKKIDKWINGINPETREGVRKLYNEIIKSEMMHEEDGDN